MNIKLKQDESSTLSFLSKNMTLEQGKFNGEAHKFFNFLFTKANLTKQWNA